MTAAAAAAEETTHGVKSLNYPLGMWLYSIAGDLCGSFSLKTFPRCVAVVRTCICNTPVIKLGGNVACDL